MTEDMKERKDIEDTKDKPTPPDDHASATTGFLIGAVVGAGLALLFAPARGQATRRRLATAARRAGRMARRAQRPGGTPS